MRILIALSLFFFYQASYAGTATASRQCSSLFAGADYNAETFQFPPGFFRHQLKISSESSPAQVIDPQFAKLSTRAQLEDEARIQNAFIVGKAIGGAATSSAIEKVVYLAAGYDSSTPFLIFKNAKMIIAVDQHPFSMRPKEILFPKRPLDEFRGHSMVYEVDAADSVAPLLLGRLQSEIPHFRLRKVTAYIDAASRSVRNREMNEGRAASHGVIEFDTGPDSPVRFYVHLDGVLSSENDPSSQPWWAKALIDFRPHALFVRGSMKVYSSYSSSRREFKDSSIAPELTNGLFDRGGVIVDADGVAWPWNHPDRYLARNYAQEASRIVTHHAKTDSFGYQGDVDIYEIKSPE